MRVRVPRSTQGHARPLVYARVYTLERDCIRPWRVTNPRWLLNINQAMITKSSASSGAPVAFRINHS